MTTENYQDDLTITGVEIFTDPWDCRIYSDIVYSVEWLGLDAIDSVIEIQGSTDLVNWSCYGKTPTVNYGEFELDAATGYQTIEVERRKLPYWRLHFTPNAVTTGTLIIRTYGVPLDPRRSR